MGEALPSGPRDFSAAQLKLIRRTVARLCSDAEFDEFIAVAQQCGLDPMRRQISPLVLHGEDPERRRMVPWTTIDGLRVIAARQGDYRPAECAPIIECDGARIDSDRNPLGLVRAEIRAFKYRDGVWFPVAGEAWWDEVAPLRTEWGEGDDGRKQPTGRQILEPNWARMGRVMLAKCAEAQALRRGWPDLMSGLYGEDELHAVRLADLAASERLARSAALREPARDTLWFAFAPEAGLEAVAKAEIADRLRAFYASAKTAAEIDGLHARNKLSLAAYWDWAPVEAFELKQAAEQRLEELQRQRRAQQRPMQASEPAGAPARTKPSRTRRSKLSKPPKLSRANAGKLKPRSGLGAEL